MSASHSHRYHESSLPEGQAITRAFLIGIGLNLGFVIVEAFFGWRVNSLALLADAAHNLSDVAGLVLAWAAHLAMGLKADSRHSYGWRRASILAAFINAIVLLVAMVSLIWEAGHRLAMVVPQEGWTVIYVALVGIVVNGLTAWLFLSSSKTDLNLRGAFLHMAADALVSLGVVGAGALYLYTAWNWLDPVVSIVISLVIVVGTWGLLRNSLHLLFDGVPEHIELPAVKTWLEKQEGVACVHDLHIWAMSTSHVALTVHLVMPQGYSGDEFLTYLAEELDEHFGIHHCTVQIETGTSCDHCIHPLACASAR